MQKPINLLIKHLIRTQIHNILRFRPINAYHSTNDDATYPSIAFVWLRWR